MTLVAPRIVNDASQVRRINHEILFSYRIMLGLSPNRLYIGGSNSGILRRNLELRISWQAQYLVSLKGDFTYSAHWKCRFICDKDHSCDSFCVAGAVLGEVGG